ncbi:MAG: hypothetical protein ACK55I_44040 [bacterium]
MRSRAASARCSSMVSGRCATASRRALPPVGSCRGLTRPRPRRALSAAADEQEAARHQRYENHDDEEVGAEPVAIFDQVDEPEP